jgi:hypothetical protein
MLDRPDAPELLAAIAAFLEEEVVPASLPRRRFHALVAANAARIVMRELTEGPAKLEEEIADLWKLLQREGEPPAGGDRGALATELATELCTRIDRGEADAGERRAEIVSHLKRSIARRLDLNNPKFRR